MTDITAEKQAREEERKLAALVAMSREFIGIAELDGRVSYLNRAAMSLVGLGSIIAAALFGFKRDDVYFKTTEEEKKVPQVNC